MSRTPEAERVRTRIREKAVREMVSHYRDRYDDLMAATLGTGRRWDARRRDALKVLRAEFPDEWRACLARARKAMSDG